MSEPGMALQDAPNEPDLINTLYAAVLRMENEAAAASVIAEQLTAGAAEARRAYETASLTAEQRSAGPVRPDEEQP